MAINARAIWSVSSVLEGHQLAPSVEDGLATAIVLEAAEQSAAQGGWVAVNPPRNT